MSGYLRTFAAAGFDLQRPADVTVVIPTILRPTLADAVRSVFAQDFEGRTQILVGVDLPAGDAGVLNACADHPPRCAVQVFYPGYSTAARHGGLSPAGDGGVLRTVLSYLGNSRLVAYLDDDNWWAPDHLRQMSAAIEGVAYAYALRWFVHPVTRRPICLDEWESVGPGQGIYRERFGGFIDPSCLMIDKFRCSDIIPLWRTPLPGDPRSQSADRTVFEGLRRHHRGHATGSATVFYMLDDADPNHPMRLRLIGAPYEAAGAG